MIQIVNPNMPSYLNYIKKVNKIFNSKQLVMGEYTKKCEEEIKKRHCCKYVLLLSSATIAFQLMHHTVKKLYNHKETHMQDYTWQSMKDVIDFSGDIVNYVDINPDDWVANEPTKKNILFIPNMTFGNVKTYLHQQTVYDSSHCFGMSECWGRGYGEILSFSPAKIVPSGEGGAIITNNKQIYDECYKLRRYHGRLSELNAAFLYMNMLNYDKIKAKHQESYKVYSENLKGVHRQYVVETHNHNVIVFYMLKYNNDRNQINKLFRMKQRYNVNKPKTNIVSNTLYNDMLVLPVIIGLKQMKLIKQLNEVLK